MNSTLSRPKIGLALGGAAARSVFYIGILEVLEEHNIPIDFIAASSSASIVAASFICRTLPQLKDRVLKMNRSTIFELLDKNHTKSGLYSLDRVEEELRIYTRGLSFAEVQPLMAFMATDIQHGELFALSIGDIAHAARISCTVPGLFEPVAWGSKLLVDGGLLSTIPSGVARAAGMDVVIGLNSRGTKYIFKKNHMRLKKSLDLLKKILLINHADRAWDRIMKSLEYSDWLSAYATTLHEQQDIHPGVFTVLGKSIDIAIQAEKNDVSDDPLFGCDLMLSLDHNRFGVVDFNHSVDLYELGRHTCEAELPNIQALLQPRVPELYTAKV